MIQWLTTAPDPRGLSASHRGNDADAGQRGWKLHAVDAEDKESLRAIARRRAACGLMPAHGWGMDLFIGGNERDDQRCKRCVAASTASGS